MAFSGRQGQPGAWHSRCSPGALSVFPRGWGRHGPKPHPALTDAHTPPQPQRPPQAMGDAQGFLLGHSTPAVSSAGFALLLKVCCCHSRLCRPWNWAYLKASTVSRPRLLRLALNWSSVLPCQAGHETRRAPPLSDQWREMRGLLLLPGVFGGLEGEDSHLGIPHAVPQEPPQSTNLMGPHWEGSGFPPLPFNQESSLPPIARAFS